MRVIAWILFVLSIVSLLYFGWRISSENNQVVTEYKWNKLTGLMGEFGTPADVTKVLGPPVGVGITNREHARDSLAFDWAFIPGYVLLLISASYLLAGCQRLMRPRVAWAIVAGLAVAAAAADCIENIRALYAFDGVDSGLPFTSGVKMILFSLAALGVLILGIAAIAEAISRRTAAAVSH